ncbi:hypothetical protein GCM10008171_12350 [Methylopila jiangsuensis]|uniref:FAD dependent oxidoreductase domain-containing protein n=1 Tax=Methylopila jiangsuensis TaxID=586230 RepID=A0A9W6JGG5_9HYPH|nr:hypothetical protein GCM10008171_12350 [Methylopila jiangsuensis]
MLAAAIARAAALDGRSVALLAPAGICATSPERVWPVIRTSAPDPNRSALQADAPARAAKLARTLPLSPGLDRVGSLTLAGRERDLDALTREAADAQTLGLDVWLDAPQAAAALSPALAGVTPPPALNDPAAVTVYADALALGLAIAAEAAGAAVFAHTPVEALARDDAAVTGVALQGRAIRAGAVVLADDHSAIRLVREGRGRLSLTREERSALTLDSDTAFGPALVQDDLLAAQDGGGAVLLSAADAPERVALRAEALLPRLRAARIRAIENVTSWTGVDGRPQIGAAELPGLWLALGFGRDALSPALAVADHLAAALAGDALSPALAPFAPTRRAALRLLEAAQ